MLSYFPLRTTSLAAALSTFCTMTKEMMTTMTTILLYVQKNYYVPRLLTLLVVAMKSIKI